MDFFKKQYVTLRPGQELISFSLRHRHLRFVFELLLAFSLLADFYWLMNVFSGCRN
jgi:hypothetical protein